MTDIIQIYFLLSYQYVISLMNYAPPHESPSPSISTSRFTLQIGDREISLTSKKTRYFTTSHLNGVFGPLVISIIILVGLLVLVVEHWYQYQRDFGILVAGKNPRKSGLRIINKEKQRTNIFLTKITSVTNTTSAIHKVYTIPESEHSTDLCMDNYPLCGRQRPFPTNDKQRGVASSLSNSESHTCYLLDLQKQQAYLCIH